MASPLPSLTSATPKIWCHSWNQARSGSGSAYGFGGTYGSWNGDALTVERHLAQHLQWNQRTAHRPHHRKSHCIDQNADPSNPWFGLRPQPLKTINHTKSESMCSMAPSGSSTMALRSSISRWSSTSKGAKCSSRKHRMGHQYSCLRRPRNPTRMSIMTTQQTR